MSDPSFAYMATVTASTKRSAQTGALSGAPAAYLTGIKCLPLDPVNAETITRLKLDSGFETKQTFVDASLDIREGDVFVTGGTEYLVRAVGEWDWNGTNYLHVVLDQVKGS